MSIYDENFYKNNIAWGLQSAQIVVPLVVELFDINSIVDFGCGLGTWLSVFKKFGVKDIKGYDGEYVLENKLMISDTEFQPCNLETEILIDKKYDMSMSLEVAEHLSEKSANMFVDELTRASDLVLFSAAVPGQGGIGHINEQWQGYWANKFSAKGFVPIDIMREKLKGNKEVRPYYRQNMIVYSNRHDLLEKYKEYVVDSPNEYMIAESVDWIRNNYNEQIDNLKRKMRIIHELFEVSLSGELDLWISGKGRKIGIFGMGDVGEFLIAALSKYDVVGFDNYKTNYVKYEDYKYKDDIDLLIVALVDNVDLVKKELNFQNVYSVEEICNGIKHGKNN